MAFQEKEIEIAYALVQALRKHKIDYIKGSPRDGLPTDFARVYYSPSAILSETPDGLLNFFNPAAEGIFGYSHEEAIGMATLRLAPEELQSGREDLFHRILKAQKPEHVLTERLMKSGERISISAWVFPYEWKPNEFSIAALVMKEK